jgi:uncharacterized protein
MSGSLDTWYSRRELESLADRDGVLGGELALGNLTRLVGMLSSDAGSVRASLRFSQRRDGWLGAELDYQASVELTCQRCLAPFRYDFAGRVSLVLADAESLPGAVPEGREPVELEEGRLLPAQLIEDELIVSIPFAPKHARVADCGSLAPELIGSTDGPAAPEAAGQ